MATSVASCQEPAGRTTLPSQGWTLGVSNMNSSTNIDVTMRHMNSIGGEINEELTIAEQEVADATCGITEGGIADMRQFCATIEDKIDVKHRETAS